jgi:hypothetical protein
MTRVMLCGSIGQPAFVSPIPDIHRVVQLLKVVDTDSLEYRHIENEYSEVESYLVDRLDDHLLRPSNPNRIMYGMKMRLHI